MKWPEEAQSRLAYSRDRMRASRLLLVRQCIQLRGAQLCHRAKKDCALVWTGRAQEQVECTLFSFHKCTRPYDSSIPPVTVSQLTDWVSKRLNGARDRETLVVQATVEGGFGSGRGRSQAGLVISLPAV